MKSLLSRVSAVVDMIMFAIEPYSGLQGSS